MNTEHNIIAIRKKDITLAHKAFANLMERTENILNKEALLTPSKYKQITPSMLELCAVDKIKQACIDSPFEAEEVKLISGLRFPDIVANKYYGIEVKSTIKDHWTSIGSSIVETTRVDSVDDIYMLFGKLGGDIPQFKCRPYQDVLYDIAVTHSPRYLIDMEINRNESIFSKMGTTYDVFRKSEDNISMVRKFFRQKAEQQGKNEMPWWITQENVEKSHSFNIKLWNTLDITEKRSLQAKCMILFPEALNPDRNMTKYNNITLWLCAYNQVVNPNIRDLYSAGGKITHINDKKLDIPVAQVFNVIVDYSDYIKSMLEHPSKELLSLISEYNPSLLKYNDLFEGWIKQCQVFADKNNVPLLDWVNEKPKFQFSKRKVDK